MKNLRIAVPNKGALSDGTVELLGEAGYRCRRSGRELLICDDENGIDFVFLRPRDIALYVGNGVVDVGITGRDLAADSGVEVVELQALGIGRSRFCFAGPAGKYKSVRELDGLRIAASYPLLLADTLEKLGMHCPIVRLEGAVEISVRLGVADAIADVVESGGTLREAGLEIIGEPLLHSEAVLIARSASRAKEPEISRLMGRINGILLARRYAMIEYNVPKSMLGKCSRITPGLQSPTVSPLSDPEWVAVKAVVPRKDCNRIMDELYDAGAKGIIMTGIDAGRL